MHVGPVPSKMLLSLNIICFPVCPGFSFCFFGSEVFMPVLCVCVCILWIGISLGMFV